VLLALSFAGAWSRALSVPGPSPTAPLYCFVFGVLVQSLGSIVAVTPLAWLSWRSVELPGVALGRRATQAWQELVAALPAVRRRPQQPTLQPTA
jgi:peptidoglycan/LPS O-acetylase OafA/YrhL